MNSAAMASHAQPTRREGNPSSTAPGRVSPRTTGKSASRKAEIAAYITAITETSSVTVKRCVEQ